MQISFSENFSPEKKYIIKTLFSDFLGLDFDFDITDSDVDYVVKLENNNQLIIKDTFFSKFNSTNSYLQEKNIPKEIKYTKNEFLPENDIPIIYGDDFIQFKDISGRKTLICGIDIFASSFFMLTRWEEYVNKTRDKHERFPAKASLAYKNNFLDRPIVNEYTEMLWNILEFLGCGQKRCEKEYEIVLTHDIDHILRWHRGYNLMKKLGKDILIEKKPLKSFSTLKSFIKSKLNWKNDPFYTFEYLMEQSERLGTKSYFFFLIGGKSKFDNNNYKYRKIVERTCHVISKRGHFVGFHPSYLTYNNKGIWNRELVCMKKICPQPIRVGRQHVLRFDIPYTWRIWEKNNMKWDSSMGYASMEGFRCGTCYEYKIYDFLDRREMNIKERPLIIMDGTLFDYRKCSYDDIKEIFTFYKNIIVKYKGNFVILWHNSNLCEGKEGLYSSILADLKNGSAAV